MKANTEDLKNTSTSSRKSKKKLYKNQLNQNHNIFFVLDLMHYFGYTWLDTRSCHTDCEIELRRCAIRLRFLRPDPVTTLQLLRHPIVLILDFSPSHSIPNSITFSYSFTRRRNEKGNVSGLPFSLLQNLWLSTVKSLDVLNLLVLVLRSLASKIWWRFSCPSPETTIFYHSFIANLLPI